MNCEKETYKKTSIVIKTEKENINCEKKMYKKILILEKKTHLIVLLSVSESSSRSLSRGLLNAKFFLLNNFPIADAFFTLLRFLND